MKIFDNTNNNHFYNNYGCDYIHSKDADDTNILRSSANIAYNINNNDYDDYSASVTITARLLLLMLISTT